MQSQEKVGIILPVYNTANFLPECLNSILNQDHSNFVVFAINDGSTDTSQKILDKYAHIDSRIKVITQKNKGLSESRNKALDLIEQDQSFAFVSFVDSDDILEENYLSSHLYYLNKTSADVSICGFTKLYPDGHIRQQHSLPPEQIFNEEEFISLIFSFNNWKNACGAGGMVWKQMYNSKIIRGIRFPSNLDILEDEPFNFFVAQKAHKFVFIPKTLYKYRQSESSLCKATNFRIRRMNARQLCTNQCKNFSQKSQLIIFSAFIESIASLLKENNEIKNLRKYKNLVFLARREGVLREKTFRIYQLFCNYPNLAKIYVHIRHLSKFIRLLIGLRV